MFLLILLLSTLVVGFGSSKHNFDHRRSVPSFQSILDARPSVAPTSIANVYDYGAIGNGQADNTKAFEAAIASLPNGGVIFVPDGQYLISGSLILTKGTSLVGTFQSVPSTASFSGVKPDKGTILLPTGGRNNESGTPFITIEEDAVVRGLIVFYPDQLPNVVPTPYPWTFDMKGNNPAIIDVECLNCFNAIRAVGAGRHYISRVQGQPINTGIFVDQTYDIGRIEDVHWNPWYSSNKQYMSWQLLHGRAFVFARTDWEYVLNTFAFGYAIGYHFIESKEGSCNGNFAGIGADMAVNCSVKVDAADPWGILITNGEFTSFVDPNFGVSYGPSYQVVVAASNAGGLRISNSAFWGPSDGIAMIDGTGTVGFSNCIFSAWDAKNKNEFALSLVGRGFLQLNSNEFQQKGNALKIGADSKGITAVGNVFRGTEEENIQSKNPNMATAANLFSK